MPFFFGLSEIFITLLYLFFFYTEVRRACFYPEESWRMRHIYYYSSIFPVLLPLLSVLPGYLGVLLLDFYLFLFIWLRGTGKVRFYEFMYPEKKEAITVRDTVRFIFRRPSWKKKFCPPGRQLVYKRKKRKFFGGRPPSSRRSPKRGVILTLLRHTSYVDKIPNGIILDKFFYRNNFSGQLWRYDSNILSYRSHTGFSVVFNTGVERENFYTRTLYTGGSNWEEEFVSTVSVGHIEFIRSYLHYKLKPKDAEDILDIYLDDVNYVYKFDRYLPQFEIIKPLTVPKKKTYIDIVRNSINTCIDNSFRRKLKRLYLKVELKNEYKRLFLNIDY